jgi:hypothetical protein
MNLKKHKTWSFAFVAVLAVFLAVNFAVWKGFTARMLNAGEYWTPDLVRLGYVTGSTLKRRPESTLRRRHLSTAEYAGQPVDVVTIGDSFSNMAGNGPDPLYQDWVATLHDRSVLNVTRMPGLDELDTLIVLANSGYLGKVRPRAVILQCAERHAIEKLGRAVNFDRTLPLSTIEEHLKQPEDFKQPPRVNFINTSNFKFLANTVLYQFSPNAFFSQVYMTDLSASLFSAPRDKRLLFFHQDLETISRSNAETVAAVNHNMNTLAMNLKQKGMTLYFLPAPNKYTVYYGHFVDRSLPPSTFFELLRRLPKEYRFIDTKKLLVEEVNKGEKDVYYSDDTHWSWKAAKKIAENLPL